MKKWIQLLACIVISVCSPGVMAQTNTCFISGLVSGVLYPQTMPSAISPAPNTPDGTVLFSTTLSPQNASAQTSYQYCGNVSFIYFGATAGAFNAVPIGNSGIGVRVSWTGNIYGISGYAPVQSTKSWNSGAFTYNNGIITLELVKVGALNPGSFNIGTVRVGLFANAGGTSDAVPMYLYQPGTTSTIPIVVKNSPTCRVATPSISVPLGNVPVSRFIGVGSTSQMPSNAFTIQLNCSGGDTGATLNVYTTLTDQTDVTNQSDTLTLSAGSTARGVGIQVLNGNTAIKYGSDSSAVGNINQWFAGSTANGTFNIPLTARYVQTGASVTPGTANGVATFTMSYQ
jgi:type 1 fimbria pilin